jgi:hypothetical protein
MLLFIHELSLSSTNRGILKRIDGLLGEFKSALGYIQTTLIMFFNFSNFILDGWMRGYMIRTIRIGIGIKAGLTVMNLAFSFIQFTFTLIKVSTNSVISRYK